MPLARLDNFLKNLNGNILYVDPNELDATDSIENRGNSKLRPFKTIQRALIESARFAYVAGSNNDLFDQTTILISPGTHYIDNRPGYYVDSSNQVRDINNSAQTISEFNILSNFDITDPLNQLYIYNSIDGGVILPKGTSIVSTDLRKTKIRPLFVPDPNSGSIANSSIFKLTGSCYIFGFTVFDANPLGTVYNTYSTNRVTPAFSHHKLTAFEYADGVNKVTRNGSSTGHTDLEMYYYKISYAYGNQSSRNVIDGYSNLQPNIDEFKIVGDLGAGEIGITSVRSGDGVTATTIVTVTTEVAHNLNPLTPIIISNVSSLEGDTSQLEYNGNYIVSQVLSLNQFTYLIPNLPTITLLPSTQGSTVKVISDTVSSSSPYVFNCSLKSVYGMNGLHADGSKATGFRSMVTAQFTGISLQKDDRAFVKYTNSGTYQYQTDLGVTNFLHQDTSSIYRPDWQSFHIKASNDAFIQCVSIFAIGYSDQFKAINGGDQSITNSNSNFGQRSLYSEGFKKSAFAKDDHGFITHLIPPKDLSLDKRNINLYTIDVGLTTSLATSNVRTRVYLKDYNDFLNPPNSKVRGYSIGGANQDQIHYLSANIEYFADINPRYKIEYNISAINTSTDILTVSSISGISTGLPVKIISKNAILPDGIENNQTYFARPISLTVPYTVKIFENLTNCQSNISPVNITNTIGLSANNLYIKSKVSDINSGDVGSPVQWDSENKNWYVGITTNVSSPNFFTTLQNVTGNPILFIKRSIDSRSADDKAYRIRYVIPKESTKASPPTSGYIIQKSSTPLNSTYPQASSTTLSATDIFSTVRNKNVIVDAWYSAGTATIVSKYPHKLGIGNTVSIYNLKSDNEPTPIGLGTGTGFNGIFSVQSVVDDLTFTYGISVNPGSISTSTSGFSNWLSTRDCTQGSNFRIPPYTIYDINRENLPYFVCNQINNHYQIYKINEIQKYTEGTSDGIYHITIDSYKNTPNISPFNTDILKFGQSANNFYPIADLDNPNSDPESTITAASRKIIGKVDVNNPEFNSTKESIISFSKDFGLGKNIIGFSQAGTNSTITITGGNSLGGIRRVVSATLGSGYDNGTYYDIPLCGGTGINGTINVTVAGGVPTLFEIANPGSGYSVNDVLTIRSIPGSNSTTTVSIPSNVGLLLDLTVSDTIQILGATNYTNNGSFVITGITTNTVTYSNSVGVTESSSNAVMILSGLGYPVSSAIYDSTTGISTVTTGNLNPFSFTTGNKVLFDIANLGICTVTSVIGITTFTVKADVSTATKVYSTEFVPTLKNTNKLNENLNTRQFSVYGGYKSRIVQDITNSATNFSISNIQGLKKGDFVQIESEIMMITRISGSTITVIRGVFGTSAISHSNQASIKTIQILPVELRRPSILRASGQTFEYTGFGPGNYSTSMPTNQNKVLTDDEVLISQALSSKGGLVVYTGMNSNGEFFIGKKKFDAVTGNEIAIQATEADVTITDFDSISVNTITVNNTFDASTANGEINNLSIKGGLETIGIATIINITDSTSCTTGALIVKGGLGLSKRLNVCGVTSLGSTLTVTGLTTTTNLYVSGISTFNSNVNVTAPSTISGYGTIPIGGIIMWSGSVASIPPGWAFCDGANGTPNLIDRFVVGASSGTGDSTYPGISTATTGGSADAVLVSHTHTMGSVNAVTSLNLFQAYGSGSGVAINGGTVTDLTPSISTEGVSAINANLPPYYALAFIMRTS